MGRRSTSSTRTPPRDLVSSASVIPSAFLNWESACRCPGTTRVPRTFVASRHRAHLVQNTTRSSSRSRRLDPVTTVGSASYPVDSASFTVTAARCRPSGTWVASWRSSDRRLELPDPTGPRSEPRVAALFHMGRALCGNRPALLLACRTSLASGGDGVCRGRRPVRHQCHLHSCYPGRASRSDLSPLRGHRLACPSGYARARDRSTFPRKPFSPVCVDRHYLRHRDGCLHLRDNRTHYQRGIGWW